MGRTCRSTNEQPCATGRAAVGSLELGLGLGAGVDRLAGPTLPCLPFERALRPGWSASSPKELYAACHVRSREIAWSTACLSIRIRIRILCLWPHEQELPKPLPVSSSATDGGQPAKLLRFPKHDRLSFGTGPLWRPYPGYTGEQALRRGHTFRNMMARRICVAMVDVWWQALGAALNTSAYSKRMRSNKGRGWVAGAAYKE